MAKEKNEPKEKAPEKGKRRFRVVYELHRDKIYHIGDIVELALTEAEEARLVGQSLEEVG